MNNNLATPFLRAKHCLAAQEIAEAPTEVLRV